MARRRVVEVTCDRCKRTETQGVDEDPTLRAKVGKELVVVFHGQSIEYEDLCRRCRSAVENYYNRMTKQAEEEEEGKNGRSPAANVVQI